MFLGGEEGGVFTLGSEGTGALPLGARLESLQQVYQYSEVAVAG